MNFTPSRYLFFLILLIAGVARADSPADRPIENYISPRQLFSEEGTLRAPYAPLAAYDRPGGKIIGEVTADLAPCPAPDGQSTCGYPIAWFLHLAQGERVEVDHSMVGYDQEALVSYRPAVRWAGIVWSQVEFKGGVFWIHTLAGDVLNTERLSSWIGDFDTWCDRPGHCAPVSPRMRVEIKRVLAGEFKLQSLGSATYDVDGIVEQGGRRYYKVKLYEVEEGSAQPDLPKSGYIPTRRKDGSHVGNFSPKGC